LSINLDLGAQISGRAAGVHFSLRYIAFIVAYPVNYEKARKTNTVLDNFSLYINKKWYYSN